MHIDLIRPHEIAPDLAEAWTRVQYQAEELESPFFSVEFTRIVGTHRDDAFVAVIRDGADPVGFFPFHRRPLRTGAPIGGQISDYQGVIAGSRVSLTAKELLCGCGLDAYDFNHALQSQSMFRFASYSGSGSPALDLSSGFEAWRRSRVSGATNRIKKLERQMRQLAREVGPLRYVADDRSADAWNKLISWKNEAYARMNVASILDVGWVRAVFCDIRDYRCDDFAGLLSGVYAGEELVAVHFGMRSRTVWHWWFPTYDPERSKYSPGLALLLECARWAETIGITRLDLGRGTQQFKEWFADTFTSLCEGSLERKTSLAGGARAARRTMHATAARMLPERYVDLQRRAFNRLLRAGRL